MLVSAKSNKEPQKDILPFVYDNGRNKNSKKFDHTERFTHSMSLNISYKILREAWSRF